jgi:hypothetical protein
VFESFAGSLNNFGSAFTPGGSVSSFLPASGSPFGSFGDYSSFGSSASSGGGGMIGTGLGLAISGGLGLLQGGIGFLGQQNQQRSARRLQRQAFKQNRKLLDRQFDRLGELEKDRFERQFTGQIAADSFGYGLERMAALDTGRLRNSSDYLQAEGRQVGANLAGRFMDPTYAARTAQMFYG